MKWSNELPTQNGWYWMRREEEKVEEYGQAEIVKIRSYCGEMCIINWEIPVKHVQWKSCGKTFNSSCFVNKIIIQDL